MNVYKLVVGSMGNNCYVIKSNNGRGIVIDPGAEFNKIDELLCAKGVKAEYILLTHVHFDHIGAVRPLYKKTGARLIVPAEDEIMLCDTEKNVGARFSRNTEPYNLSDIPVFRTVSGGDVIDLDDVHIDVYHTPGHTLGSMMYRLDDMIFSGDTLFKETVGVITHYGGNLEQEIASVKRIAAELEGDYKVLPGHGSETTLEHERRANPYME